MKKTLLVASMAAVLSACSGTSGGPATETWDNFGSTDLSTSNLADNQTLAVFYRQADINGPAVSVFVDQHYQGSLLPNSVSPIAVCAAKQSLFADFSRNDKFDSKLGTSYTLPVGEVAYFKAVQQGNGVALQRVDAETAKEEIKGLRTVTQNISRVQNRECGAPVLAAQTLDAKVLFALGSANLKPEGQQILSAFAAKVGGISNAASVQVSGYTDPVGTDSFNQKLSQRRAESVKAQLVQDGVGLPIKAVGYGEKDLVVANCEKLHRASAAITACNAPNRRVEVAVYGQ